MRRDASQNTSCTTSSNSESPDPSNRAASPATYPEYLRKSASKLTSTPSAASAIGGARRSSGLDGICGICSENDRIHQIRVKSASLQAEFIENERRSGVGAGV